ncbi:glycosaminoglycan attachment site [Pseudomonas sp. 18058]|uniref:glycosaminoglycan attachment site n=1 Tax=Pseudomonas sp. 18058 TaxID=2681406 RepID=UPI002113D62F|nr:glycosaminoglycan attachment site [Pseudomonas sp. 18058]
MTITTLNAPCCLSGLRALKIVIGNSSETSNLLESSFWELYLFAALREWGLLSDLRYHAPDFVVKGSAPFCLEATTANPPAGGQPPYGFSMTLPPTDFTDFNIESTLRICNSFDTKVKKHRNSYSKLAHVQNKPSSALHHSTDLTHILQLGCPIMAALYGLYHDESATRPDDVYVQPYNVTAAPKNANTNIDVGLLCDDTYTDVSAVVYSSLDTWGKLRALAENPDVLSVYTTLHPRRLIPVVRTSLKQDYSEHLMDGLYVLHNPVARNPIPSVLLSHPRVCAVNVA